MKVGRMIAAGTMAMGAWRAYKQFKGDDHRTKSRGRNLGRRGRHSSQRSGVFSSVLNRH